MLGAAVCPDPFPVTQLPGHPPDPRRWPQFFRPIQPPSGGGVPTAPYSGQSTLATSKRRTGVRSDPPDATHRENLAQEVLGKRLIADEPKKPAVDVGPMPGEQSLHRWFAANGDLSNQVLV